MRDKSVLSNLHIPKNPYPFFISFLPSEILQDIFILCARDYHYRHSCPTKSLPSWVNVSYVCRHWRNVALNCPTLWTHLFIMSRRWTEQLLARSEQASLKIRVSFICLPDESLGLSCLEVVMDHVERIQELLLHLLTSPTRRVLSRLSSRAPRLQDLDISVEYPNSSVEWPSLPFDGDTPALRTLRLTSCPVPLHSFRLSALTVLHLANVPVQFRQNMEEFLAALSRMQDLEHLYLHHALPSATGFLSSAMFKTFEKIDLPHLSRLLIGAPLSTTVTLLSCINIPLKAQVRLECNSELDSSLDYYALLPSLLAQRYKDQAQSSPTILSLVIHTTEGGTTLTFSPHQRDTTSILCEKWDHNIPLYIGLNRRMVDRDTIMSDICSSMPLSNVQTLSVVRPLFSPASWRRILRQLQDIRYIALCGGNMPDLSMLSLTDHTTHDPEGGDVQNHGGTGSGDRGQSHILAPRLEELQLAYISFLPDNGSSPSGHSITRRCLFDALSTRQGSPGQLVITRGDDPGYGTFDMVAVWGDDGFHVVSEDVYPPKMYWAYDDDDDDEEGSVHSPEVDLEDLED